MKLALTLFVLMVIATPAFAYGYHTNKYGTGYYRDDSNDGNYYNNANYNGINDDLRQRARNGQRGRIS